MKRHINKFLAFGAAFLLFAACEEEAELTVLEEVNFPASPEVSTSAITLTEEKDSESVITISWPEVEYPVEAPVTYSMQLATPADTLGDNAWANAFVKEVGLDVQSASLTGLELNEIALDLGIEPETEGTIVMRVRAYLDRATYSQPVAVKVTPYAGEDVIIEYPSLWVAGAFQGWDVTTAPTIASVNDDGVYEGYIYIPEEAETNEFKLYAQPAWEPLSYGDGGGGTVIVHNDPGNNFVAPSAGYYFFAVDLNAMTYLLIKIDEWNIIGDATPGGWEAGTPMTFDPETQTWSVTADMKADGAFKFLANNDWTLDFGIDEEGNLRYENHPWLEYVEGQRLTVPEDGNYTITLDLHPAGIGNYSYDITRN